MRTMLTLIALITLAGPTLAQSAALDDRPKPYSKQLTPREREQRQSLYLFVHGVQFAREDKVAEALKAFMDAAKLDPEAPALYKAQVLLLIGMERYADALSACQKVVALDADDYAMWYVIAKLQRSSAKYAEAIAALESGLKAPTLKDNPGAGQQLYLDLGALYEITEKFGPAADAFHKAAEILEHPDRIAEKSHIPREAVLARAGEAYEKIGQLYRKAKQYDRAIASLRTAQERAPEHAGRLNYTMAQVCDEQGNLKQAVSYISAYLDTRPLSTDAYELKIGLLRRLNQDDAIVPWLEEAAKRERFNNALQLLLAQECLNAKQLGKAEAIYKKMTEEAPSPELYRGLFKLHQMQGVEGNARVLTMLDNALDKNGPPSLALHAKAMIGALRDEPEVTKKIIDTASQRKPGKEELKYETMFLLAVLADQFRNIEAAERFYKQCLPHAELGNEAIIYNGLLRVLGQARKNEQVVTVCEYGLKNSKGTNSLLFYKELARAQAALHRYDDALQSVDRAMKQAGDDNNRLLFKVLRLRILAMAERFDAAEKECLALIADSKRPGEIIELRYLLSNIYSSAKQQGKSEEQLQLVLKIDPDNATVNNDLGYLWADQGKNLETAEAMIRKALEVDRAQRRRGPVSSEEDKDNASYVDSLGWVLFRRGQTDEARKELERAAKLPDSDDPVIYDHLGDVYDRLKMRPEATRAWERALELYHQGIRGREEDRIRDLRRKLDQVKQVSGGEK